MGTLFSVFYLLTCFCLIKSLHLPKYIKACGIRKDNFKECAIQNGNDVIKKIINGDRKYNIPPADPLVLPAATVVSDDVNLNITDITLHGLKEMKITDMKVNLENKTILLQVYIPLLNIDFKQKIRGKISAFVIQGEGPGTVNIYEGDYRYVYGFEVTEKKGQKYLTLMNEQFDFTPKKMTFKFKNLFNGDENLGNHLTDYLNENWMNVVTVLRPSLTKIGLTISKLLGGTIFEDVPVNEIFPDFSLSD